ncbi:hypothetical protein [Saccharopolyspora sp. 5N708]
MRADFDVRQFGNLAEVPTHHLNAAFQPAGGALFDRALNDRR